MIEDFIREYAKKIVIDTDKVKVTHKEISDEFSEITIFATNQDVGKLIGKDGHMINALKTLISGCKAKDGRSYKISIKAQE